MCFPSISGWTQTPKLFINELVALPHQMKADPYGEYDDWIEIYNAEDTAVCLAGYYITDNYSKPHKAQISHLSKQFTTIAPKGHLLLWLDKGTRGRPPLHVSLKLKGSGEVVALYSPDTELIDSVQFPHQKANLSYARMGDGNPKWDFAAVHTPNATNVSRAAVFAPLPVFSLASGMYSKAVSIRLSGGEKDDVLRYTMDGTTPSATHGTIYSSPIQIDYTTIIRAGLFGKDKWTESIMSHTYFIKVKHQLPIVSLATDSMDIILRTTDGNYYRGENPAHFEYFKNQTLDFNGDIGFRLLGLAIRYYPQKSFGIRFRSEYGRKELNYPLFKQKKENQVYRGFALRNSGNDNNRTLLRDGLMHTLVSQGTNIDYLGYQPIVAYVNGKYWGILNLREKISQHYIKENYPKKGKSIDLLEWKAGRAIDGDEHAFMHMWQFISKTDLSVPDKYVQATSMIDLPNFIDYHIAQTFYGNTDWPMANIKYWRPRKRKGKWRWILFDTDLAFELNKSRCQGHHNSIQYLMGHNNCHLPHLDHALQESTTLFRAFMKNASFRNRFISRYIDLLNTNFKSEHVLRVIDRLVLRLAPEMPAHISRWSAHKGINSMENWKSEVNHLRTFASQRPDSIRHYLTDAFSLGRPTYVTLNVKNTQAGTIRVNSVTPEHYPFKAVFFEKHPIRIMAIPNPGFRFVRWEELEFTSERIEVLPISKSYTAVFQRIKK